MPKRNYHESFKFHSEIEIQQTRLKDLFKIASRTTADIDFRQYESVGTDFDIEFERSAALFWQQYSELLLHEEPDNPLLLKDKQMFVDPRVDDAFNLHGLPWELIVLDEDS